MSDLPAGFLRAEARWLEEPDTRCDVDAAYDAKCNQAYDTWKEEQGDDE